MKDTLIPQQPNPPTITICDDYAYDCLLAFWFGQREFRVPREKPREKGKP